MLARDLTSPADGMLQEEESEPASLAALSCLISTSGHSSSVLQATLKPDMTTIPTFVQNHNRLELLGDAAGRGNGRNRFKAVSCSSLHGLTSFPLSSSSSINYLPLRCQANVAQVRWTC